MKEGKSDELMVTLKQLQKQMPRVFVAAARHTRIAAERVSDNTAGAVLPDNEVPPQT